MQRVVVAGDQVAEWRLIGRRLNHGVRGFEAVPTYAMLRRGDRGDLVLLAQELLRAWGFAVRPGGAFGGELKRAVELFQRQEGLEAKGVLDDSTWEALVEREPGSTNWKWVRVPGTTPAAVRDCRAAATSRIEFYRVVRSGCTTGHAGTTRTALGAASGSR